MTQHGHKGREEHIAHGRYMSTREMQLISRIVRTGDLNSAIEWGITVDDFLTPEGMAMWNSIVGYHSMPETAGSVVGENFVRENYENFILCDDLAMTTPALCSEVRNVRIYTDVNVQVQKTLQLATTNPLAAAAHCQNAMSQIINLGMSKNTDVFFSESFDQIVTKYEMKKAGIHFDICQWPWLPLNYETGGVQPDEYCIFYGRPKSMKSWVLAALIAFFYMCDKKVLIYTKEMTPENIFMRVAACLSNIEYRGLRMGDLSEEQEQALYITRDLVRAMKDDNNLVCLSGQDAPEGGDTIPWLKAKIERHQPDLVAIDGLYMMSDVRKARKREEKLHNITRDLRQMILNNATAAERHPDRKPSPVIATLQATRKAAEHGRGELDEIAYSDAFGQDVTLAARVINDRNSPTISLIMAGTREFELPGFRIHGIPATNFTFHSNLTMQEIEKAKEKDTPDDEKPAKITRKKKTKPENSPGVEAATRKVQSNIARMRTGD